MKQRLLELPCSALGHDWREKDDPDDQTCCICGALRSEINPHLRSSTSEAADRASEDQIESA